MALQAADGGACLGLQLSHCGCSPGSAGGHSTSQTSLTLLLYKAHAHSVGRPHHACVLCRWIKLLKDALDPLGSGRGLYFSHSTDVTLTQQRLVALCQDPAAASKPLWARADTRFFYNKQLAQPLIGVCARFSHLLSGGAGPIGAGQVHHCCKSAAHHCCCRCSNVCHRLEIVSFFIQ